MLVEISIENYLSIKHKVTLSMEATSDKSLDCNVINLDKEQGGKKLLRSVVIYGANASGKTNVLSSIIKLRDLVKNSHKYQRGQELPYTPFKFDEDSKLNPTRFEITFIQNNIKYIYQLSYNKERVIDESLYYYPNKRKAQIFQRRDTTNYKFNTDKKIQKAFSARTLPNQLYLSISTQQNYQKIQKAFDWFDQKINGLSLNENVIEVIRETINNSRSDPNFKKLVLQSIRTADLGIIDIVAETRALSADDMPEELKDFYLKHKTEFELLDIKALHKAGVKEEKKIYELDWNLESDGTRRFFFLMGPIINAIADGQLIIIDELDTQLHQLLHNLIIKLFHDPIGNKYNAQLIFATHNTNLLNQDIFRRDQIWFTERDPDTLETDLYSLVEFKPRKDKDIQKGYLAGRYGGLPYIGLEKFF